MTFGAKPLLAGAELSVSAGERICLVGRNGSGKSTLLRLAAGLVAGDGGSRFVQPGTVCSYLPQEPDFAGYATTLDYAASGLAPGQDRHAAVRLLDELGLTGREDPQILSGGEARRAALARTLAPAPDVLLLDEPTNHLDLPAIEWLERELAGMRAGVVLISHDRRMLHTLGQSVVWLDRGITRRMERGFAQFEPWRDEVLAEEERDRHKLSRKIAMEEDWLRYGVTARRKRNQKRLADLHGLRDQRRSHAGPVGAVRMAAAEAGLSGRIVVAADHVAFARGDRPIVADFSTRVLRGDRVGIIGPNGAGKTTLLNLLTGALTPDSGEVRVGASLARVALDQGRSALDPARTLAATLTGGRGDTVQVGGQTRHVMGYLKDFLFTPQQVNTPVGALSGGERGRLLLALAFATPSNLMVLDEPTNDLDLETLDLLQELLADYGGTVLLVSHDRDFLDRVATSLIRGEGDGQWVEYAGGYSDMLAQLAPAAPVAAPVAAARPREPATPARGGSARRLSFKDKHALEGLPGRIAGAQAAIAALQARLADPGLYGRDPARFAAATAALAAEEAALAAAEEEWLRLELLREAVEAISGMSK